MSVFEICMLVCFGSAWPFSIYRSYHATSTDGKSPTFLIVLIAGYICGILNKLLYHFDYVIFLYILNLILISIDLALWIRNRRREKCAAQQNV